MSFDGPLSAELRERTREHHTRAERHPLQGQVARGSIPRHTWGRLVAQNRVLQEAMERALDAGAASDPRIARVFAPHHRRLGHFDQDLHALSVADRAALPATAQIVSWIGQLGSSRPVALLGALYVIEGATNGGQFLSRALGPALGVPPGAAGLRSLDPHGPATRELWQGFRERIDALDLTPEEREAVVAAAGDTFDALTRIFDAVAAEGASTPPTASVSVAPAARPPVPS